MKPTLRSRTLALPLLAAALTLALAPARAATITWTGTNPADAAWDNPANWDGGIAPTGTDTISLQNGYGPIIGGTTTATFGGFLMATITGTTGAIPAGTFTLIDSATISVIGSTASIATQATGAATITLANNSYLGFGDVTIGNTAGTALTNINLSDQARLNITGQLLLGYAGQAFINATGTTTVNVGTLNLGRTVGSFGTVRMAGSSTLSTGNANIGFYRGSGTLTLSDNATMTAMGAINIGMTDGANNVANTNGYLALTGSAQLNARAAISVGNFTRGELHISDHATVTAANVMIGTLAGGNVNMKGNGLITLNGDNTNGRGTLLTASITRGVGISGTILFNGGILRSSTNNPAFLGSGTNATILTVFLAENGAYIDSNGHDIGATNTVIITGTGALNKIGAGTLTLNGTTSHTGATNINEGALALTLADQLLASTRVNISADAILSSHNIAQTLHNLAGEGAIQMDTAALTLNNTEDTAYAGNITAVGGLVKNGPGSLTLSGENILSAVTHNEGTLGIANDRALGDGALAINNAATLRADADATIANTITVTGGPLHLDTIGTTKLTINGALAGTQGIVKNGAGSIVFANNTAALSGAVDINAGELIVAGLGATTVTIADTATFGGSGLIQGNVTYLDAGALQLGATHNDSRNETPSTLTIQGTLTLHETTIKYDTYGAGASDKLVADTILFGGPIHIDLSSIREGAYTLIHANTAPITIAPNTITTTRNGVASSGRETLTYTLSDPQTLQVAVSKTNAALTWTALDGNNWDYNTAASWTGADTRFIDGDRVTFAGADATGTAAITIDANGVTAADMTVTGNAAYTFAGNGRITTDAASCGSNALGFTTPANGKFTMNGTGTVTFANASNSFLSGIDILQGTVIGNAQTLAIGAAAAINNAGTLVFKQDTNDTYANPLLGAGAYVKTGSASLLLTSPASAPAGSVTIRQGSLLLSETARLGTATVSIENGALFGGSGTAASTTIRGGGILQVGIAIAGPQVGTETLRLSALAIENTGRLTGSGTLSTTVTLAPAATAIADIAANRTLAIDGQIKGDGGLTKEGPGNLVITTPATYTGATTITTGTLSAGGPNVFSANSTHIIKPTGILNLSGYDQTLGSLINEGAFAIGKPGAAGARLTLTNGYIGATNSAITFNLHATDTAPTAVDQLIIAGGNISGTTTLRVNVYDQRANPAADNSYLNDIPALVIVETGTLPAKAFRLAGNRVVIGNYDYHLYNTPAESRLVAVDSAETPAVMTINPLGIAVNRATLNSLGQRLDYLRDTTPGENETHTNLNLWLQGYYRRDRFYDSYWAGTRGAQIGADFRGDLANGGTAVYGLFADYTTSDIDLDTFNNPRTSLDSKSLGAYLAIHIDNWCTDFALKYSWDNYTIKLTDTPEFDIDGASWAGLLRLSYLVHLKKSWTLVPQVQLLFQARGVQDTDDTYGRHYIFGEKYARITETNSLEGRVGISARKLITLKSGKTLRPYLSIAWLNDFHGDMTVTTVNEKQYTDDLGGGSFQVNAGLSAQLGNRITAVIDAALQNGGKVDSYSINAGINYRW